MKDSHCSFEIFTQSIETAADHSKLLAYVFEVKEHKLKKDGSQFYKTGCQCTCGLIMKADFYNTSIEPCTEEYVAVVPAHFVLTEDESNKMKISQGNKILTEETAEEIAKRMIKHRYDMELFNSQKKVDLHMDPPLLAFRHCKQVEDEESRYHPTSFMNDILLLQLKMRNLPESEGYLAESDLKNLMRSSSALIELDDPRVLCNMGMSRVSVKVGSVSGYIIPSGFNLRDREKNKSPVSNTSSSQLLTNIQFIANE